MGVAAISMCAEAAYWIQKEREVLGGYGQKCFDHYAFYIDYNVTTVFYSARKVAKGGLGTCPQKISFRKFQSMISDKYVKKTVTR